MKLSRNKNSKKLNMYSHIPELEDDKDFENSSTSPVVIPEFLRKELNSILEGFTKIMEIDLNDNPKGDDNDERQND